MEPQICRLCLRGCGSQMCLQIFNTETGDAGVEGNVPNVAEILRQHFWFEVTCIDYTYSNILLILTYF